MSTRRRTLGRRMLSVAVAALLALFVLAWFGSRWERAEQEAARTVIPPPPGEMVQAGARTLHIRATGGPGPGILLISGLGESHRTWGAVQDRLSERARVVSYDRPGLGWSPPPRELLSLDAAVEDVALLLSQTELFSEPPILVGHSLGGAIARRFAYRHPDAVAGLVLLDPTPLSAMPLVANLVTGIFYRITTWSASAGLDRWRLYRRYPEATLDQKRAWAHLSWSGDRAKAVLQEYRGFSAAQPIPLRPGGLGELPLFVLSAPLTGPPGFGRWMRRIEEGKRQMSGESHRGRLVETTTGHYVHYDDPDLVIREIRRMIDALTPVAGDPPATPTPGS